MREKQRMLRRRNGFKHKQSQDECFDIDEVHARIVAYENPSCSNGKNKTQRNVIRHT